MEVTFAKSAMCRADALALVGGETGWIQRCATHAAVGRI